MCVFALLVFNALGLVRIYVVRVREGTWTAGGKVVPGRGVGWVNDSVHWGLACAFIAHTAAYHWFNGVMGVRGTFYAHFLAYIS